jgi:hypothetical protein
MTTSASGICCVQAQHILLQDNRTKEPQLQHPKTQTIYALSLATAAMLLSFTTAVFTRVQACCRPDALITSTLCAVANRTPCQ